jgi:hypothetical protein
MKQEKKNVDRENWIAIMKFQNYFLLLWKLHDVCSYHSTESIKYITVTTVNSNMNQSKSVDH